MLDEIFPNSLGDHGECKLFIYTILNGFNWFLPTSFFFQTSLYGQIIKWFQNDSYMERNVCDKRKKKASASNTSSNDNENDEAKEYHLSELLNEVTKNQPGWGESYMTDGSLLCIANK